MKTLKGSLSIALMSMLFALTSWAQNAEVRGRLRGNDVDGVEIMLQATGGASYTFESDAEGNFVQAGVAPGLYELSFIIDDSAYLTAVRVRSQSVEIELNTATRRFEGDEETDSGRLETVVRNMNVIDADAFRASEEANSAAASDAAMRAAFEAGVAAMDAENFDEAVIQFSIAASGSTEQLVHANLGLAYERSEMWEEAAASYEQAQTLLEGMETPPEGVNYFPNLTLAYAMAGNVESALENAEKGAVIDPTGAGQAFYNVGAVLTNQGDTAGASQAFERAIEVNPEMAEAYFQLALGYLGTEDTIPDAVPLLERYLELAPTGPNADAAQGLLEFASQ